MPDGVGARPAGSVEADDRAEEAVGDLDQDAGAVAGVGLGAGGAAVVEVARARRGPAATMRVAGATPLHVDDERDAAGVVLEARVVEARGGRAVGPLLIVLPRKSAAGPGQGLGGAGTTLARTIDATLRDVCAGRSKPSRHSSVTGPAPHLVTSDSALVTGPISDEVPTFGRGSAADTHVLRSAWV